MKKIINKTKTKEIRKKKKISKSALVLILSCVIIAIPIITFGVILLSAVIGTGKPILGQRFANDLNPAITKSIEKDIKSDIESLSDVEGVELVMTTAQLRINIDASDTITEEEALTLAEKAYQAVDDNAPIDTYFTYSSDGKKMYDLQIVVYNYVAKDSSDENWIYYQVTKNSKMEEPLYELSSKAKNEELAQQLRNGGKTDEELAESETK